MMASKLINVRRLQSEAMGQPMIDEIRSILTEDRRRSLAGRPGEHPEACRPGAEILDVGYG